MNRYLVPLTVAVAFAATTVAVAQTPSFDPESLTCGEYREMDAATRKEALKEVDLSANEGMATEGIDSPDFQAEVETACADSPDVPLIEILVALSSE